MGWGSKFADTQCTDGILGHEIRTDDQRNGCN